MKPELIIIHCSATKDSGTVSWQAIRRYHVNYAYNGEIINVAMAELLIADGKKVKNPWSDVGYHYGCELVNNEFEILTGRSLVTKGAHCKAQGVNGRSLGFCFVGDFESNPPPPEQLNKGAKYVAGLCTALGIEVDNVRGHCEFEPRKTCPGTEFDMDGFRKLVKSFM